jgi:glutamyl-tRNA reductase
MLEALKVHNFHPQSDVKIDCNKTLVIKTCQRVLAISHNSDEKLHLVNGVVNNVENKFYGPEAYEYLLEIICGLQSKLVGENEIVGQFKTAYRDYCSQDDRESSLLLILEKLFKDAKEVRSNYLLGLCQKTYASIARKHLVNINKADEILILGSGTLAEDLINQFKKKATVYISARNSEQVNRLANLHDIKIIPWKNIHLYQDFPFIANTIGFAGSLLDESFFNYWNIKNEDKLFIDLGSPSAIHTDFDYAQGVMRLDDIFNEGAVHENHKREQVKKARSAIAQIVEKRYIHLKEKKLMRMKGDQQSDYRKDDRTDDRKDFRKTV